jgi:hypothetical protein
VADAVLLACAVEGAGNRDRFGVVLGGGSGWAQLDRHGSWVVLVVQEPAFGINNGHSYLTGYDTTVGCISDMRCRYSLVAWFRWRLRPHKLLVSRALRNYMSSATC